MASSRRNHRSRSCRPRWNRRRRLNRNSGAFLCNCINYNTSMSWEAFRLTSKSPSELLHTLGPHGVDDLMRQALNAVWRDYPPENRSYDAVRAATAEVFNRNMRVWSAIKKPTPDAFFTDLQP